MMTRTQGLNPSWKKLMIFARILALLGLASCVSRPAGGEKLTPVDSGKKDSDLHVLFIGNSYSFEAPKKFEKLARQNGHRVKVSQSTVGGWNLKKHIKTRETLDLLNSRKWDVIVIQDYSLHPGSRESSRKRHMDPGVQYFVKAAREMGAQPYLYQTWGRRDGNDKVPGDNFYTMNARVRTGYRNAAKNAGGVEIIPVGDRWEDVFRSGNGTALFHEDGSHPSSLGDNVTAQAFFDSIFKRKISG